MSIKDHFDGSPEAQNPNETYKECESMPTYSKVVKNVKTSEQFFQSVSDLPVPMLKSSEKWMHFLQAWLRNATNS
jgi:hypothetical protein